MTIEEELQTSKFSSEKVKAMLNVMFTSSWLRSGILTELKKFGLYHEQYNVLRILAGSKGIPLCQRDILERMIDRNSNLTRILAKLKEKELVAVSVNEGDKREYVITISTKGEALLAQIVKECGSDFPVTGDLTDTEAQMLNLLLDKMRKDKHA